MKIKLTIGQNIEKDYELPEQLGDLICQCWNAGSDGVPVDYKTVEEGA